MEINNCYLNQYDNKFDIKIDKKSFLDIYFIIN